MCLVFENRVLTTSFPSGTLCSDGSYLQEALGTAMSWAVAWEPEGQTDKRPPSRPGALLSQSPGTSKVTPLHRVITRSQGANNTKIQEPDLGRKEVGSSDDPGNRRRHLNISSSWVIGADARPDTCCTILSRHSPNKETVKIRKLPFYNLEDLQKLSSL